MNINAIAHASAFTAKANASVYSAAKQTASAAHGNASVSITNNGLLNVEALAGAVGFIATANATAYGAYQTARAHHGSASANFVVGGAVGTGTTASVGTYDLIAKASASGFDANAKAYAGSAIYQNVHASSGGNATANITNNGNLTVAAIANATGVFVHATATNSDAIYQSVHATSGNGAATYDNAGSLMIAALASAQADGTGNAAARISNAVYQNVRGDNASASLTNSGSMTIIAQAVATGETLGTGTTAVTLYPGTANAQATVTNGVHQSAVAGSGAASASISNAGTLEIAAVADAHATGSAKAVAHVGEATATFGSAISAAAISQNAHGSVAHATVTNAGTLDIAAVAKATGSHADALAKVFGGIAQHVGASSGNASASILNNGTLSVIASAAAHGGTAATAHATVKSGIAQHVLASGSGNASGSITGSGTIDVAAIANATATGKAFAEGLLEGGGITELVIATGHGNASATFDVGNVNVIAEAHAVGASASAYATNKSGLFQGAGAFDGGNASASFNNTGTINIAAMAAATATNGAAIGRAFVKSGSAGHGGLSQIAEGRFGGTADAAFTNSGSITVAAIGSAKALAGTGTATNAGGFASAVGEVVNGVKQLGETFGGGDASATFANSGSITVAGMANATGNSAFAEGLVLGGGLRQGAVAVGTFVASPTTGGGTTFVFVPGGNAVASLTNSGTITIVGSAKAHATNGAASAIGVVASGGGVIQSVVASGSAAGSLNNSGTISVAGLAAATGVAGAFAGAEVSGGLVQIASAVHGGSLSLTNSGTVNVIASAAAHGTAGFHATTTFVGTGTTGHFTTIEVASPVRAQAINLAGLVQEAHVFNGNAAASLTNSGTVNIIAMANAIGAGATMATASGTLKANVDALAVVGDGILQRVTASNASSATVAAHATANLTNSGKITIAAVANAKNTGTGSAVASAIVSHAVDQAAGAIGNASATISNSGSLAIDAVANATGGTTAAANALVHSGIGQLAVSGKGTANATLVNAAGGAGTTAFSGSISVIANAKATNVAGVAHAGASIATGISQVASGVVGNALVNNEGSITIGAVATANGGLSAIASGAVDGGLIQVANAYPLVTSTASFTTKTTTSLGAVVTHTHFYNTGAVVGNASASITNSGTLDVVAEGNAIGTGAASAHALVTDGIYQSAHAGAVTLGTGTTAHSVGGNATATIENSGTIAIVANAVATGSNAHASANVLDGIFQAAIASVGNASASINNSGSITVAALAKAKATAGFAGATADITRGVMQTAVSHGGGNVSDKLVNSGTISVIASAAAVGMTSASAHAMVRSGVIQHAFASGSGNASGTITGTGTINVAAIANATATGMLLPQRASSRESISRSSPMEAAMEMRCLMLATSTWLPTLMRLARPQRRLRLIFRAFLRVRARLAAATPRHRSTIAEQWTSPRLELRMRSSGPAEGIAILKSGISQIAEGQLGGNASAMLNNSGSITIAAMGSANALAATGTAAHPGGIADAVGSVVSAMGQHAIAIRRRQCGRNAHQFGVDHDCRNGECERERSLCRRRRVRRSSSIGDSNRPICDDYHVRWRNGRLYAWRQCHCFAY